MKMQTIHDDALALEIIYTWADMLPRIVGAGMKRNKVSFSDNSLRNIYTKVNELENLTEIEIYFRESLRFVDMGAGNGYHKGKKINASKKSVGKPRRKKAILNKPLFRQFGRLNGQLSSRIIDIIAAEAKAQQFDI